MNEVTTYLQRNEWRIALNGSYFSESHFRETIVILRVHDAK